MNLFLDNDVGNVSVPFSRQAMHLCRNRLSSSVYDNIFCDCQRGKDLVHPQKKYTNKRILSVNTGRNDDTELFEKKITLLHEYKN